MNKIIYIDCDGVLLDWVSKAGLYLTQRGIPILDYDAKTIDKMVGLRRDEVIDLVYEFQETVDVGNLPPIPRAIPAIRRLHEDFGFVFRVVTCMGVNPYSRRAREYNLDRYFGSAIDSIEFLCHGEDKTRILEEIPSSMRAHTIYIDDYHKHIDESHALGIRPIYFKPLHTIDDNVRLDDYDDKGIIINCNWDQVADTIEDRYLGLTDFG